MRYGDEGFSRLPRYYHDFIVLKKPFSRENSFCFI
nr:MAG TPA: hypothetical protein [Caudoviricetes sp.]